MSASAAPAVYDGPGLVPVVVSGATAGDVAVVGPLGAVRELVVWCERRGLPVDTIRALDAGDARLDPVSAVRLASQLRGAGAALRAGRVPAVGWDGPGGLAGGVFAAWPTVVSTCPDGPIVAEGPDRAGLRVPGVADPVSGWGGDGRPGGPTLVSTHVSDALAHLTGGWGRVVQVPATSVVAALVVTAADIAERCARAGAPLRVWAGG